MSETLPSQHGCEWQSEAERLRAENAELKAQKAALEKLVYGKKSEKLPRPTDELRKRGDIAPLDRDALTKKRAEKAEWKKQLPEETVEHKVAPPLPTCELCHGQPDHPMPPEISRQIDYIPARAVVRRHVRQQLRCPCGSCIVTAPAPPRVGDQGMYGPGLVAHAVLAKCADSMPLYRLAQSLQRSGIPISDATLGGLFHKAADLLRPLYARMLVLIRAELVVQADETRIQVQAKQKTRRAWMWVFLSGQRIVYVFSPSRSGDTPVKVLGNSTGALVVDAYTGYNAVCTPEMRERVGCLAHVRRKLFDAMAGAPEMRQALDLILEVYKVEHEARETGIMRSPKHREMRQARSKPAMQKLHEWLSERQERYLPQEPAGKAIRYALNNWPHLTAFLDRPELPPDNNLSEGALRVIAKTRDASLFVGTDEAGENLAVLMSLVQSAKAAGINPQEYLADVLVRVQTWPSARVDELLPENWSAGVAG